MSDGLLMKYFVLKPMGYTAHAVASRRAMREYADAIRRVDRDLAHALAQWADQEAEDVGMDDSVVPHSDEVRDE